MSYRFNLEKMLKVEFSEKEKEELKKILDASTTSNDDFIPEINIFEEDDASPQSKK